MADATSKWAIGIYAGESPFRLAPHPAVANPVISRLDVSDVTAQFVADPFMLHEGDTWYMFFEVLNQATNKGEVGLATSADALRWTYRQIVLAEPFHLSYPYVFEHGGDFYMLPETVEDGSVRLYRATKLHEQWLPYATLLEGIEAADASIFFHAGRWWLFACTTPYKQDTLRLYMADEMTGPWVEHPRSPLIAGDARAARPAGRVLTRDGGIVRFAQDCSLEYGTRVMAFEVTELTTTTYEERCRGMVLRAGDETWNGRRMHHLDSHVLPDGSWIACVDGDCARADFPLAVTLQ